MIDARGYSCPIPVIMVQKELKKNAPAALEVLVDDRTAFENVMRFAQNAGYGVESEKRGEDFLLRLTK